MKASHVLNFSGSFNGSIFEYGLGRNSYGIHSISTSFSFATSSNGPFAKKQNGHIKSEYTFIFTVITFTPYLIVVIKSVTLMIKKYKYYLSIHFFLQSFKQLPHRNISQNFFHRGL